MKPLVAIFPGTLRHFVVVSLFAALSACGGGGGSPTAPATPAPPPAPDATIGPAGGTVTAFGGAVRLVVPAGALSAATGITIRASSQVPLDPHWVQGSAYELGPVGLNFATPASLVIRYERSAGPSGVPESDLHLHGLDGADWEAVAQATTDVGANEASGPISVAAIYGVRWLGPRGSCGSSQDHQFDFWLGSWDYHQGNLPVASNEITKEGDGCLVEEHFQDPTGVQGRSVSLFSREDSLWHQTYVDSRGSHMLLIGGLDGRRMVLNVSGTVRQVWDPLDADTVHYFAETTSDGGQTWILDFEAQYTRR